MGSGNASAPRVPCQATLSLAVAGRLGTAEVISNQRRGHHQFRVVFLWGEGRRADFSHAAHTQRQRLGLGTGQHGQAVHTPCPSGLAPDRVLYKVNQDYSALLFFPIQNAASAGGTNTSLYRV